MTFSELLNNRRIFLDGGTGTLLQACGLNHGDSPELWNLTHPQDLIEIHRAYYKAGADVVVSNTFGANPIKLQTICSLEDTVTAAIKNLRTARDAAGHGYVALDVGPTGQLLKPLGTLDFDQAVDAFSKLIEIGVQAGAELISIETMTDLYELKAAVLAARQCCDLPVLATVTFDRNGRLLTGGNPAALIALLEGLGVAALGVNCGVGPIQLADTAQELVQLSSIPVILKPNAGLPCTQNGCTHYDIDAEQFAQAMATLAPQAGLVGGCCGTTPEHITKLCAACASLPFAPPTPKDHVLISSGSRALDVHTLDLDLIPPIQVSDDLDDLLDEVFDYQDDGAVLLRLDFSQCTVLTPLEGVEAVQAVTGLPLWLEGISSPTLLEDALRRLNGKAMLSLTNTDVDQLTLLHRYGGIAYDHGKLIDCHRS